MRHEDPRVPHPRRGDADKIGPQSMDEVALICTHRGFNAIMRRDFPKALEWLDCARTALVETMPKH